MPLGGLRLTWRRSLQVALVFGICDGLAPLVGILVGRYWSEAIGETAEYVGAIALGLYGASLGLLGFSPWLAPVVFGVITALMVLLGLQLGRAAAGVIHIRSDLLTGVALVVMATVLGPNL